MKMIAIYKKRISAAFLSALIFTLSSVALAKTYLGSGGTSCAEYMAIKQAAPDAGKEIDLWLLGYVSGLNFYGYANNRQDLLINQSAADVLGFVQGYCSVNGNKTLNNGLNEYWFQMTKRYVK